MNKLETLASVCFVGILISCAFVDVPDIITMPQLNVAAAIIPFATTTSLKEVASLKGVHFGELENLVKLILLANLLLLSY
jgi:hypothetical protein